MGPREQSEKLPLTMGKLATDGSNWSLWHATLHSYFESKNLLKYLEGVVDRPPDPPTFPKDIFSQMMRKSKWIRQRKDSRDT